MVHTVLAPTLYLAPRRHSSPWTRRYPQVGFSPASRSTSSRICAVTAGRPRRCGLVQRRHTRSRCHRSSVAGCTSSPRQAGRAAAARARRARPGLPVKPRPGHLAWQHRDLVAQDEQLGVLGRRTPRQQCELPQHMAEHEIEQSQGHAPIIAADGFFDELAAQHRRPTSWHPTRSTARFPWPSANEDGRRRNDNVGESFAMEPNHERMRKALRDQGAKS